MEGWAHMASHPTEQQPGHLLLPSNPASVQPELNAALRVYWRTKMKDRCCHSCNRNSFWMWSTFKSCCVDSCKRLLTYIQISSQLHDWPKQAGLLEPTSLLQQIRSLAVDPDEEPTKIAQLKESKSLTKSRNPCKPRGFYAENKH